MTEIKVMVEYEDNSRKEEMLNVEFDGNYTHSLYKVEDMLCERENVSDWEILSVDGYDTEEEAQQAYDEEMEREAEETRDTEEELCNWLYSQGRPIFAGL